MATHRWTAALLAILACTAAGCSSTKPGRGAPATTTPAANSPDRAVAAAINLSAADLPGWTPTSNTSTAADKAMQGRLAQCAGAPDPASVQVLDAGSPTFRAGQAEVTSDVTTVRSEADARADLQAMQSTRLPACIQQVAVPYLASQLPAGTTLAAVTVQRLVVPDGIRDGFSYRLLVPVSTQGKAALTVTSDTTGFLVGRAEVELNVTQTGAVPDPSLESRLFSLLHQRAERVRQPAAG